jgi:hypothetical protein
MNFRLALLRASSEPSSVLKELRWLLALKELRRLLPVLSAVTLTLAMSTASCCCWCAEEGGEAWN